MRPCTTGEGGGFKGHWQGRAGGGGGFIWGGEAARGDWAEGLGVWGAWLVRGGGHGSGCAAPAANQRPACPPRALTPWRQPACRRAPTLAASHAHPRPRRLPPPRRSRGLGLTTWSPLASGVLTGKYSGGEVPAGSRFTVDNYKV